MLLFAAKITGMFLQAASLQQQKLRYTRKRKRPPQRKEILQQLSTPHIVVFAIPSPTIWIWIDALNEYKQNSQPSDPYVDQNKSTDDTVKLQMAQTACAAYGCENGKIWN
eukprot:scaffold11885_cov99-Cylindrotheca_fusiformis.AAC.3